MQHPARTELWAILRLSGPLIASQLAHMLMVLTDTLMMARLSPEALAGGGLGAASYSFVAIFCIGVIAAVGTLVAIRHGAGDIDGATRLTQAGLWLRLADGLGGGAAAVEPQAGAADVRPDRDQRGRGGAIPYDPCRSPCPAT